MKPFILITGLLTLLITESQIYAQQDKFIIGAYMQSTPFENDSLNQPDSSLFSLWRAKALGINTAMIRLRLPLADSDYVGPEPQELPSNMEAARDFDNVIGMNQKSSIGVADGTVTNNYIRNFDWIFFYSGAYYSKWDATLELVNAGTLGLKHDFGNKVQVNGIDYWSSGNNPPEGEPLLVRGPNYNQETRYRSSTKSSGYSDTTYYRAYFNLKLRYTPQPGTLNDPICEIIVKATYTLDCQWHTFYTETKASRILTVGDIGNFNSQTLTYDFSDYCPNNGGWDKELENINCDCTGKYLDNVEFQVKYLGNQELLINYVEVYDRGIWEKRFATEDLQNQARQKIAIYLQRFDSANPDFYSNNLKYFFGIDEPHSVDSYVPLAFVENVLDSLNNSWLEGAPLLFIHLYPEWNGQRNDADVFPPYINTVHPQPMHFYYNPYLYELSTEQSLDNLRIIFKWLFEANGTNDFYFTLDVWDDPRIGWRGPTPSELNAGVMLALAHGAKGIFYEPLYSYGQVGGLLEPDPPYNPKDIGIKVRDDINPRLAGLLGATLLRLEYTGNEICLRQGLDNISCTNTGSSYDYLSIDYDPGQGQNIKYDFNGTFLEDKLDPGNKFFMITNSLAEENKSLLMEVNFPSSLYKNLRLRNVEGGLDTTYRNSINLRYTFPKGEGYLFQTSPVVKYGGKLYYAETINENITLYDDMIIENGVTLTVNGNYTCYGNIYLKGSAKIETTGSGHISMANGKAIILLQLATIRGSQDHYLTIDCASDSNAVVVNSPGGLTVEYCSFTNGRNAIKIFSGAGSININHCSFNGQTNAGVLFLGSLSATPKIKYSTFSNSSTAIWAIGVNGLVVFYNTFTDNVYDVKLNLVTNAQIVSNTMDNSSYVGQGVFLTSTSGYIRQNQISGHLNGIYLANSSPNIGGNNITNNAKHGIYIGTGSVPDLRGYLVQDPCQNPPLYYPLRGYNTIYENGLAGQNGIDNDGSEIYLAYASILMNTQCNDITDDRNPNPAYSVKNLIGGIFSSGGTLHIESQG